MPNHVTHRMRINGTPEDVAAFKAAHVIDGRLDFHTVIPMPEPLRTTEAGSVVEEGIAVLLNDTNYRWLGMHGINTLADLRARLDRVDPAWEAKARQSIDCSLNYGHGNWYDWACANWGTKWNAYDCADLGDVLKFDTAWASPKPVFAKLAMLWPSLKLFVESFDEGWNFAMRGTLGEDYREVPTDDDIYERVYGCKPRDEE